MADPADVSLFSKVCIIFNNKKQHNRANEGSSHSEKKCMGLTLAYKYRLEAVVPCIRVGTVDAPGYLVSSYPPINFLERKDIQMSFPAL